MMCRPYGVRMSTVGRLPDCRRGNHRSATRTTPSGILAARSRSTATSPVCGGGSPTRDAAMRLHAVMVDPPVIPLVTVGASGPPSGGVEKPEDDRIVEGLPARLNDVLGHPDGGPGPLAVRRVDQYPGDGAGSPSGVEDPDSIVGQVDVVQHGELGADRTTQGPVERIDGSVALGHGVDAL